MVSDLEILFGRSQICCCTATVASDEKRRAASLENTEPNLPAEWLVPRVARLIRDFPVVALEEQKLLTEGKLTVQSCDGQVQIDDAVLPQCQ